MHLPSEVGVFFIVSAEMILVKEYITIFFNWKIIITHMMCRYMYRYEKTIIWYRSNFDKMDYTTLKKIELLNILVSIPPVFYIGTPPDHGPLWLYSNTHSISIGSYKNIELYKKRCVSLGIRIYTIYTKVLNLLIFYTLKFMKIEEKSMENHDIFFIFYSK